MGALILGRAAAATDNTRVPLPLATLAPVTHGPGACRPPEQYAP